MEWEWRKIELFSVAIKAKFEMRHQNKSCHFPQNLPSNKKVNIKQNNNTTALY